MKKLSTLALATTVAFLQTGCFNRTAETKIDQPPNRQSQAAQTAQAASMTEEVSPAIANPLVTTSKAEAATSMLEFAVTVPSFSEPDAELVKAASLPPQLNISSFLVQTPDGDPLKMRASSGSDAEVIATLPQGTSVLMRVGDPTGTWFEVSTTEGQVGWVAGAFLLNPQTGARVSSSMPSLEVAPASVVVEDLVAAESSVVAENSVAAENSAVEGPAFNRVVQTGNGDSLNMRAAPHLDAEVVRALPNGTRLNYEHDVGPWSRVVTADGLEGFVATDYLVVR